MFHPADSVRLGPMMQPRWWWAGRGGFARGPWTEVLVQADGPAGSRRLGGASSMMEAVALPRGTLTFLLSDVEGSTRRWEDAPEAMAAALPRSLALVEDAVAAHGGYLPVEQGEGDSRLAVFERTADAVRGGGGHPASACQRGLAGGCRLAGSGCAARCRCALARRTHLRRDRGAPGGPVARAWSGRADLGLSGRA